MTDEPEHGSEADGVAGLDPYDAVDFDDLEVIGAVGAWSAADARQSGDDAVGGLDKITAQMSGGEHRPEQQEMCRAVAEALATKRHLVVQAGTGTGKSLAYLVPGRAQRAEGRRGHGDQGAAGPAGRQGPAAARGGARAAGAARLRRAEGSEQLPVPPAGARGGLGRGAARAG